METHGENGKEREDVNPDVFQGHSRIGWKKVKDTNECSIQHGEDQEENHGNFTCAWDVNHR